MSAYEDYRKKVRKRRRRRNILSALTVAAACLAVIFFVAFLHHAGGGGVKVTVVGSTAVPESVSADDYSGASAALTSYMTLLSKADYENMYQMLTASAQKKNTKEDFVARNQKIYQGIGARNFTLKIQTPEEMKGDGNGGIRVSYTQTLQTNAGEITQDNSALMKKEHDAWKLEWSDAVIFPDLAETDTIKVTTTAAQRGNIYDRNGVLLAGTGEAEEVGLIKGQMDDQSVSLLADALDVSEDFVNKKLNQKWVTDDSFVPIKTVSKLTDQELMADQLSNETRLKSRRDRKLKKVAGIMTKDTTVRVYPLGECCAHLIGYVQTVTAEDLSADTEGNYSLDSLIGKTGCEVLYEDRLRGTPGRRLRIVDESGNTKKVLAVSNPVNGEDIRLSIDSRLQQLIYQVYQNDEAAAAAINPYSGEVLALVSTPSYDPNEFVLGVSQDRWDSWNSDPANPLLNRFRQTFTPGSSFKPVTAAIGLTDGSIDPDEDYGTDESWQKDDSWGSYKVTTLHAADPAKTKKALIVSDNVYFAKAALKIGQSAFESGLNAIGFNEQMPFPIEMSPSTFSNSDHIATQIQLADSGYGQGEMQVNPLHLLSIYSGFVNDGSMITPVLEQKDASKKEMWKTDVFSKDACERIRSALRAVVTSGTGVRADMSELELAGKTGTAEIKASQSDTSGTELGWFTAWSTETDEDKTLMMTAMVQNVKERGGSSYVVERNADIMRAYCTDQSLQGGYENGDDLTGAGSVVEEPYDDLEADPNDVPDPYSDGNGGEETTEGQQ